MQPAFQVLPATGSPRAGNTSRRKIGASFPRAPIPLHSQLRPWFPPAALHTHTHNVHSHAQRTTHSAGCWAHSHRSLLWPLAAPATHCTLYIVQPTMGWPVNEKKKLQKFYDIFQVSAFFFSESNCSFKNNLRLAVSWFLSSFFLLLPFLLLFIPLVPLNMQTLQLFSFILNCTGGHIKSVFLIDVPPLRKKNLDHMYIGIYG